MEEKDKYGWRLLIGMVLHKYRQDNPWDKGSDEHLSTELLEGLYEQGVVEKDGDAYVLPPMEKEFIRHLEDKCKEWEGE